MNRRIVIVLIAAVLSGGAYASAPLIWPIIGPLGVPCTESLVTIPRSLNHQGVIAVSGVRFNGNGLFRFAIVNTAGNNLWTNDNSNINTASQPTNAVTLAVVNGAYNVQLGGARAEPPTYDMEDLPPAIFADPNLKLRIWFDDNAGHGVQRLLPDQALSTSPYSFHAQSATTAATADFSPGVVPIGAIVAWHKDLGGVPQTLPCQFMECTNPGNSLIITDPDSPLVGQPIPDLNSPPPNVFSQPDGGGRFLRGGYVSGVLQQATGHYDICQGGYYPNCANWTDLSVDGSHGDISGGVGPGTFAGNFPTTYRYSRPFNMSVVWIMRIK